MDAELLTNYRNQVHQELVDNILPFYRNHSLDRQRGGFHGYIANDLTVRPDAPRGVIQVTRILWAYAHAWRTLGDPSDLETALRAYEYIMACFVDRTHGGLYWMVSADGQPRERQKMVYAQSFGIYAFAELYRANRDPEALQAAKDLYALVETRAYDAVNQGYAEGRATDWYSENELRIDPVAGSVTFSMNTHLHLVEAYTNLYLAWPDKGLRDALERAVRILIDRVLDRESGHFGLHFDAHWRATSHGASPGHDIEGSWLMVDAAEALGNQALLDEIWPLALRLAQATLEEGIDIDDGIMQEAGHSADPSPSKDWWPQAEAMIGFLNAYQKCGFPRYLNASLASWNYIQKHIIDRANGEWFWGVTADGVPLDREKTGPWKGPYHNGRACMEVMRRVDAMLGNSVQSVDS